jgi:hypothetical protein
VTHAKLELGNQRKRIKQSFAGALSVSIRGESVSIRVWITFSLFWVFPKNMNDCGETIPNPQPAKFTHSGGHILSHHPESIANISFLGYHMLSLRRCRKTSPCRQDFAVRHDVTIQPEWAPYLPALCIDQTIKETANAANRDRFAVSGGLFVRA